MLGASQLSSDGGASSAWSLSCRSMPALAAMSQADAAAIGLRELLDDHLVVARGGVPVGKATDEAAVAQAADGEVPLEHQRWAPSSMEASTTRTCSQCPVDDTSCSCARTYGPLPERLAA